MSVNLNNFLRSHKELQRDLSVPQLPDPPTVSRIHIAFARLQQLYAQLEAPLQLAAKAKLDALQRCPQGHILQGLPNAAPPAQLAPPVSPRQPLREAGLPPNLQSLLATPPRRAARVEEKEDDGNEGSESGSASHTSESASQVGSDEGDEGEDSALSSQIEEPRRAPARASRPLAAAGPSIEPILQHMTAAQRHEYELKLRAFLATNPTETEVRHYKSIILFFTADLPAISHGGRLLRLSDVRRLNSPELEAIHNYIQWIFPLKKPSRFNLEAPLLTADMIAIFKQNQSFLDNLLNNCMLMTTFWGFSFDLATRRFVPSSPAQFNNLMTHPHNFDRITRMLKCLIHFGRRDLALAFYEALVSHVNQSPHRNNAAFAESSGIWRGVFDRRPLARN